MNLVVFSELMNFTLFIEFLNIAYLGLCWTKLSLWWNITNVPWKLLICMPQKLQCIRYDTVCMLVRVFVCLYLCLCTYVSLCLCISVRACVCVYVCMCVCGGVWVHWCTCLDVCTCVHLHTYVFVCVYIHNMYQFIRNGNCNESFCDVLAL